MLGKHRLTSATAGDRSQGERDPADEDRSRHQPRDHDGDRQHRDVERDLIELREGALGVRSPADRDQDPDGERREQADRDEGQPVDAARADAIPIAAPAPSSHQAAMPAYDRVVGAKPPFA